MTEIVKRSVRRLSPAPLQIDAGTFVMRRWRDEDRPAFAASGMDPDVMRYFPQMSTQAESDQKADKFLHLFETVGVYPWVIEIPGEIAFAGIVGISENSIPVPFDDPLQVGWRLVTSVWNRGIATVAARLALIDFFERSDEKTIVAYTAIANIPSQRVMEKIGMTREYEFPHPLVPAGSPLSQSVLYRLNRKDFERRSAQ